MHAFTRPTNPGPATGPKRPAFHRRPCAALPLAATCLFCCLSFFPARSDAGVFADSAPPPAPVQYTSVLSGNGVLTAMGGGDDAALGVRNESGGSSAGETSTGETSAADNIFGGSFVGALLFGYPYTGFGGADLALFAFAGLMIFRIIARRSLSRRDDGRFNVRDRQNLTTRPPDGTNVPRNGAGRGNDAGQGREQTPEPSGTRGNSRDDPHDNLWTRRMGGPSGGSSKNSPWSASGNKNGERPTVTAKDRAAAMWAHLSSEGRAGDNNGGRPEAAVAEGAHVPQGFDVNDFLDGARALYVRLQDLWGRRELAGLEDFLSPEMMAQLRKQAEKRPEAIPVNVMLVEATLKDMEAENGTESARVLFKALIRTGDAEQPSEVREEWLFRRGGDSGGMWRLTGIQGA